MATIANDSNRDAGANREAADSKAHVWTARILTAIAVIFIAFDGITKLIPVKQVTDAMVGLGWQNVSARGIGALLLICLVVYLIPRTAVLGVVLLTGYLGGAVAANVRIGNPLFSHTLFPVYVALMLWGGLYLREPRLRALLPFRGTDE